MCPEGPECRIIAEGLSEALIDNCVSSLEVISGRYAKRPMPEIEEFNSSLPAVCNWVGVKGKFIWIELARNVNGAKSFLWSTLGMSGTWLRSPGDHTRLRLDYYIDILPERVLMGDDVIRRSLYFNDPRNFGTMTISFDEGALQRKLDTLGVDVLNDDVTLEQFMGRIRRKKHLHKTLAETMMDQTCLAGVGNYVKAEALFRARLSPHRVIESLDDGDIGRLYNAVRDVLLGSYASKGMTRQDYRDIDGNVGRFKRLVYGQSLDPEGHRVVVEETLDGRSTHWVPEVQV